MQTGCTRPFWRLQADREAYSLVDSVAVDPRWPLKDFTIVPDPRARIFDPDNPDRPPMPMDDPTSHRYMHCVDCKGGFPCWHEDGDTKLAENPYWRAYLPLNEDGELVLDMRGAVDQALLQSRDFQGELEDLYLSALDVSFERFRFDTQFFGGYDVDYEVDGKEGGANSILAIGPNGPQAWRAEKLYASGGQLVVEFANQLVWQFSGSDSYSARSLLDFSLVQPLLRGAGRAVVLERLTIAERVLLANVRQMERFRRGFYLDIAIGRGGTPGPQRRGGVFGGAGLQGFTGVGAGGFGQVGGFGGGGGGGGVGLGGAGAAQAGGFLGLLQDQKQIENEEYNIAGLRDSLAQLVALNEAGRIDRFQVDLARQALYNAQSRLLNSKAAYDTSLDFFKLDLGLPPDMDAVISDDMLDAFKLVDPRLTAIQEEVDTALNTLRDPELADEEALANVSVDRVLELRQQIAGHVAIVEEDLRNLEEAREPRESGLELLAESDLVARGEVDPGAYSIEGFRNRVDQAQRDAAELINRFDGTTSALLDLAADPMQADLRGQLVRHLTDLSAQLIAMTIVQARARLETIAIEPIELEPKDALEIARVNRRDWMNARASLVDAWRLIRFNANDLMSDLSIIFNGDISTTDDRPFRFRDTTGRLNVGVQFDAPLTRVAERNRYRQSQIEFQQAQRDYTEFVDGIYTGLRSTLRTIEVNEVNLELNRAAVLVAIDQVDLTRLQLQQPPRPGEVSQLGATAARDLVDSLTNLLAAQNNFLSVWVNYELQRMNLDFDLGTMQLDYEGQWIDPGTDFGSTRSESHPSGVEHPHPTEEIPAPDETIPVQWEADRLPIPASEIAGAVRVPQSEQEVTTAGYAEESGLSSRLLEARSLQADDR